MIAKSLKTNKQEKNPSFISHQVKISDGCILHCWLAMNILEDVITKTFEKITKSH